MNELHIREATRADLGAIVAMENRMFSYNQLSRRSLRHFIDARSAHFLVADAAATLIGYALVCYRAGSRLARLYSLCADTGASGRRGVGRELLKQAEMHARARGAATMLLEVKDDNQPALRLYAAMQYETFDRYEDYYEDGGHALRLRKPLVVGAAGGSR